MTAAKTRRNRARGGALRWARGAVLALCAALAVLVHHEAAAAVASATSMSASMAMDSAGHSMHEHAASAVDMPTGYASHRTEPQTAEPPAKGDPSAACSGVGMQHCSTASVNTVYLAAPPMSYVGRNSDQDQAVDGPTAAGATGRAPPDLSVLSRLRI